MPLPETVRVKLSSEAAGAIAITPVVVREMPLAELVDWMLGVVGKDAARIREILARGTLVSGASRFRWAAIEAHPDQVAALLGQFPDSDPTRAFDAARCVRVVLRGASRAVELTREVAARRRFLRRRGDWDEWMALARQPALEYIGYSYGDHADRYRLKLPDSTAEYLVERQIAPS